MTRLRPILKVEEGGCSHLQSLLEKTYLKSFAQLETKRKCYSREDKVNIVIDATDWGHSVGEIEIIVMDHDHITEATSKIETIGAELGKFLWFFYIIPILFQSICFYLHMILSNLLFMI